MEKGRFLNIGVVMILVVTGLFSWSLINQQHQITQDLTSPIPQGQVEMTQSELTGDVGFIHVNTDSATQLEALPGIGPALAQRIVDYRNQEGPFQTMEDLTLVSGIGEKTLAEFAPYIVLDME